MIKITSLSEFRNAVASKDEIREAQIGTCETSFCYMIAAENTFDSPEARECRGIVFNHFRDVVVGRPLHKFFNVGERESTRAENIDWSKVIRVMDKRDGSMIHTVWSAEYGLRLKSKKSYDSDVAKAAENWMHSEEGRGVHQFCLRMQALNKTAIFEWTAPDARIVLLYTKPELVLLHVRDNVTGEYMRPEDLHTWANEYGVRVVDEVDDFFDIVEVNEMGCLFDTRFNVQKMLEAAKTREGIEGWIVQFEDGDMVKVKTDWYLRRHRAMTFLRERDIVELVLDEGIDDLKSLLVTEGVDVSEIIRIENEVVEQLRNVRHLVEETIKNEGHRDRKEFAIEFSKTHADFGWFGLLMTRYTSKEPDYKEWYRKWVLKDKWTLRQLVLIPSVAEGE